MVRPGSPDGGDVGGPGAGEPSGLGMAEDGRHPWLVIDVEVAMRSPAGHEGACGCAGGDGGPVVVPTAGLGTPTPADRPDEWCVGADPPVTEVGALAAPSPASGAAPASSGAPSDPGMGDAGSGLVVIPCHHAWAPGGSAGVSPESAPMPVAAASFKVTFSVPDAAANTCCASVMVDCTASLDGDAAGGAGAGAGAGAAADDGCAR
jgi:hypothetical protein